MKRPDYLNQIRGNIERADVARHAKSEKRKNAE